MPKLPLYILVVFLALACENDGPRILRGNTGNQGEIIVVAPAAFWKSDRAEAFRNGLSKILPGLPAAETMFKVVEVNQEGYSDLFKTHRNIIQLQIDPTDETKVEFVRDLHARQQLVAKIKLQAMSVLDDFVSFELPTVLWRFHKAEVDRLISRNKAFGDPKLNEIIMEATSINILMQQDFILAKTSEDVVWLRLDRQKPIGGYQHDILQGLLIYSRPYTDTAQFGRESLWKWKNQVDSITVSGPSNSYMTISTKAYQPEFFTINHLDQTAIEIRGLWRMAGSKGVFMGGPFYALSFYNPQNKLQYMIEGYVYAPQFDKTPFVREIEALAKSVTVNKVVD